MGLVAPQFELGLIAKGDRFLEILSKPILAVVAEPRRDLQQLVLDLPDLGIDAREDLTGIRKSLASLIRTLARKVSPSFFELRAEAFFGSFGSPPTLRYIVIGRRCTLLGKRGIASLDFLRRKSQLGLVNRYGGAFGASQLPPRQPARLGRRRAP